MNEKRDKIKEIEENGKKYTIQYLEGDKLDKNIPTKKIIILGLSGSSKTKFSYRLLKNEFKPSSPTISLDLAGYKFKVNDKIIQIQIWDSCGNDDFCANTPNLYKNTFIAIILYEVDNRYSFYDIEKWYNLLRQNTLGPLIYLIGNISEEEKRQINTSEGENIKKEFNFNFFMEVSVKSGFNAEIILDRIAIDAYENSQNEKEIQNGRISLAREDLIMDNEIKRKKKFC